MYRSSLLLDRLGRFSLVPFVALLLAVGMTACQPGSDAGSGEAAADSASAPPVVDITAADYAFVAPDTIRSGWTTLRMHNQGSEHHLFALVRLPDRVTYEEYENEVVPPFDSVWSLVVDGTIDREEAPKRLGPVLPDWRSLDELMVRSGVGLTAPTRTGETTVDLEPGTYVLECFVLTSKLQFHFLRGMDHPLTVVPASSDASPPAADQQLTVANLQLKGVRPVSAGKHTFAVHFEKDPQALPFQHLHLARLDENTDAEELAQWMTSLDPVMPAPTEFLGGAGHMPAGNTTYVTANLEAGRYAWVLGVPPDQGEVETFTVE